MVKFIIPSLIALFITGCFPEPNIRTETVIDRIYVPKECPTYYNDLNIQGSKFSKDKTYNETMVIIELDSLLLTMEQNKMARETFNKFVDESNEHILVPGTPETNNFKRIEKRIFVNRECPSFYYSPEIKAKKLTENTKLDMNTTYVVVTLDNMVTSMEHNKLSRDTFNAHVDTVNSKTFIESAKEKYDSSVDIVSEAIDETIMKIKEKIVKDTTNATKTFIIKKITK